MTRIVYLHFEDVELVEHSPQIAHILGNTCPDAILSGLQVGGQLLLQVRQLLALEASIHAESPMLNGGLYLWNQIFEEIQVGLDHAEDKKRRNPRTCDGF